MSIEPITFVFLVLAFLLGWFVSFVVMQLWDSPRKSNGGYAGMSNLDELRVQHSDNYRLRPDNTNLKIEIARLKAELASSKTNDELEELKSFVTAGDKIKHAGAEYVCLSVGSEIISTMECLSGEIIRSKRAGKPHIKCQMIDTDWIHDPIKFYHEDLPYLRAQNQ